METTLKDYGFGAVLSFIFSEQPLNSLLNRTYQKPYLLNHTYQNTALLPGLRVRFFEPPRRMAIKTVLQKPPIYKTFDRFTGPEKQMIFKKKLYFK